MRGKHSDREVTNRVRQAREGAGLNKAEFAERMGMTKQAYHPYEAYKVAFTVQQLFAASEILNRSVQYFLGLETELTPEEDRLLTAFRKLQYNSFREGAIRAVESFVEAESSVPAADDSTQ